MPVSRLCGLYGLLISSMFSRRDDDGTIMLIGVYVDDIVLAHNSPGKLKQFVDDFTGPKG